MNARLLVMLVACVGIRITAAADDAISDSLKQQILSSKDDVDSIIGYILNGGGKGNAYQNVANISDQYGPRVAGKQTLEEAIEDMQMRFIEDFGASNVKLEDVTFPLWQRGSEKATLLTPRLTDIALISLFLSPPGNVTAEVVVVSSFQELDEIHQATLNSATNRSKIFGKIVVYNQHYTEYSATVLYRSTGASAASRYGASGALINSITPYSIYSPHTGGQSWAADVQPIPVACITAEDSEMLQRLYQLNTDITIRLEMTHNYPAGTNGTSRNIIVDMPGTMFPDQYIIFGGHFDSWDVGTGSMDDLGGCFIMAQILLTLKALKLQPKRTLRLIFFTAEELGIYGGNQYFYRHKDELLQNISFVMESDYGTFNPLGLSVQSTSSSARAIIQFVLTTYLSRYNMSETFEESLGTLDVDRWIESGVPGVGVVTANDKYFNYHHSHGDRVLVYKPDEIDRCSAMVATVTYVVANLDDLLPRTAPTSSSSVGRLTYSNAYSCLLVIGIGLLRV